MVYRVRSTPRARRDLDEILQWLLEKEAGTPGLFWFQGVKDTVASLRGVPRRCGLARENGLFPYEVRQLIYGRKPHFCRILFTIDADTVIILHIRHGRRLPLTGK